VGRDQGLIAARNEFQGEPFSWIQARDTSRILRTQVLAQLVVALSKCTLEGGVCRRREVLEGSLLQGDGFLIQGLNALRPREVPTGSTGLWAGELRRRADNVCKDSFGFVYAFVAEGRQLRDYVVLKASPVSSLPIIKELPVPQVWGSD